MTISSVAPTVVPAGAGTGFGASTGSTEPGGLAGLFAGILGAAPVTGDPAGSGQPGSGEPGAGQPGSTQVGSAQVGSAQVGSAQAGEVLGELALLEVPSTTGLTVGVAEILGAAQIMAAAQVVPVTPVLSAALAAATGAPAAPVAPATPAPMTGPVTGPVTGPAVDLVTGPATGPMTGPAAAVDMSSLAGAPTGSTAVSAAVPVAPSELQSAVPLGAPAATEQAAPAAPNAAPAPAAAAPDAVQPTGTQPTTTAPTPAPTADHQAGAQASTATAGAEALAGLGTVTHHDTRRDHSGSGRRPAEQPAEPVNATASAQPTTSTQAPQAVAARQEAVATSQVTGQVFPEVTRLVSRGDGTQRITITLSPEALGDVRVVLTVRDGDVHVRMVGSELAQQALRAGAPELHRLLDLAGAGSSQIVVGDHSSSADAGLPSGASDRHSAHNPNNTEDHRTAGTRDGDTTARDGYPGAQQPRRSTEPTATSGAATSTLAGVDVTI